MKFFKQLKNLQLQLAVFMAMLFPAFANATTEGTDSIWAAVDISGIQGKVIGIGVLVIGVAMAWASIRLGRKGVGQVK